MITVKVIRQITIPDGQLVLNAGQVARRTGRVEKVKGDTYRVVFPVQFKTGEVIGIEAIPKHLELHLSAVESGKATPGPA